MTQAAVARRLGVSRSTINLLANGKTWVDVVPDGREPPRPEDPLVALARELDAARAQLARTARRARLDARDAAATIAALRAQLHEARLRADARRHALEAAADARARLEVEAAGRREARRRARAEAIQAAGSGTAWPATRKRPGRTAGGCAAGSRRAPRTGPGPSWA
jgi:transcriptional regulator with XRE-family HTH domain